MNWYGKYLEKPTFKSRGIEAGADGPSPLFKKYFTQGNVDYLGRAHRYVRMKDEEVKNTSFSRYLESIGVPEPKDYRMAIANMQAGFLSVSKYDKFQPAVIDDSAWEVAGEWTIRHFQPFMGGSRCLQQDTCVQESKLQTSCGWPWSLKYHTKEEFYADAQASAVLSDYWDMIGQDRDDTFPPIWSCSQKVELRSVDKLLQNKLRTFTAAPIEHSIALNRLCLDMNNKFYRTNNKHWSFVGGNKYLQGWDSLYLRLNKHPNAFELDESEYDSSLFARAMFGQMEIRWAMLRQEDKTAENRRRLVKLYESVVHSIIVLENGEIIQKHTGNPSGSANTIVDNTMILFRLFAYAWILGARKRYGEVNEAALFAANCPDLTARSYSGVVRGGYVEFMTNVEAALNGDDNTFTVSDACVDWFNPTWIAQVWSAIGVTTKTPSWNPRPLHECTFLSSAFVQESGLWLPKPDTGRVLSSMLYGGSDDDVRWHMLRACALRVDSWANHECRSLLQGYIEYLNREYAERMVGEVNGLSMDDIRQVYKSDSWIWELYAGFESGGGDEVLQCHVDRLAPGCAHRKICELLKSEGW